MIIKMAYKIAMLKLKRLNVGEIICLVYKDYKINPKCLNDELQNPSGYC